MVRTRNTGVSQLYGAKVYSYHVFFTDFAVASYPCHFGWHSLVILSQQQCLVAEFLLLLGDDFFLKKVVAALSARQWLLVLSSVKTFKGPLSGVLGGLPKAKFRRPPLVASAAHLARIRRAFTCPVQVDLLPCWFFLLHVEDFFTPELAGPRSSC